MITRRITFNLNDFLTNLNLALENKSELVENEVQKYKDFLSHTKQPLKDSAMDYVNKHNLTTGSQKVRSFIEACHKDIF